MEARVADHSPITLGEARQYAGALPADERDQSITGCYKIVCPLDGRCCKGRCIGLFVPCQCGSCVYTPSFFLDPTFLTCFIGLCFCNCIDDMYPGAYSYTDLKGNYMGLVKVSGKGRTLAFFTESTVVSPKEDALGVCCYCEK